MTDQPYLSVIVPCYNESENLRRGVLAEMHAWLSQQSFSYEVIIADDGSTDASRDLVQEQLAGKPGFRLLAAPHGGKPSAVWHGLQAALGQIVLFTDMDQSTPIDQGRLLQPWFERDYGVVIGSRGLARENFPLYRRIGSGLFGGFRRVLLLHSIRDTQCGFKAMRTAVAREVFPLIEAIRRPAQVTGWKVTAFDVELLFLANKRGHRIAEVPVAWADRD
ncbi:MAG: glycosyltransferase, partial [Chloroflexi bacterium]|nr:glycosyltransferase [Chloroflexota bacterium]